MATSDEPVWGIPDDLVTGDFYPSLAGAPTSWAMGATFIDQLRLAGGDGEGEVVCVLDTGADPDHPEFVGRWHADPWSDVPNESPLDRNRHGPHCMGTAAGVSPTVGVANVGKVMSGKCLSDSGSGVSSWIQNSFRKGLDRGATVFSISIGGPGFLQGMEPLFAEAEARGVCVAVAAGNERQRGGLVTTRSSGLVVAAVDRNGRYASFSNPAGNGGILGIAAPGVDIVSARTGGGYMTMSGTSMATPFVAGVMAAFNSARVKLGLPKYKTSDFKKAFSSRAIDAGTPGPDRDYGPGLIDCHFLRSLLIPNPPEVK